MLTDEVKKSIDESVLCWLATVDQHGEPNCSPKEVFTYFGDQELLIADIASPKSVRNIQHHGRACVSFIHVLKQRGFKLTGQAHYCDAKDAAQQEKLNLLQSIAGDHFPVKGVMTVTVEKVAPIVAPGYYLIAGTTEASQIAAAKKSYGM